MKIDAAREGGSAVLQLEGRLDREWAEHLSGILEDLLQNGVRSLRIDFGGVTYVSSPATKVLARWHQELAVLRGEVQLTSVSSAVEEAFAVAGWDWRSDPAGARASGAIDLRRSSWQTRADLATRGHYELSSSIADAALTCRLHGDPGRLTQVPLGPEHGSIVDLPDDVFGLGLGAIGGSYEDSHDRFGELVAVAGCVAYFPTDGALRADYLVGSGPVPPRAVLASGLTCRGGFSRLVRFGPKSDVEAVALSELAGIGLEAAGGGVAGMVIVGETAGLSGVRIRHSPASGPLPVQFDFPAVGEWLLFAQEPTHAVTTTLIAGVVANSPDGPLAPYLRPLGHGKLCGHFHAAVFSYHPLPQRTVELTALVRGLFANHQLRDVVHLVWDDRGEAGVGESALLRGVAWAGPITQIC